MRRPLGFTIEDAERFQKLIDRLTGISRDQPIIKLVWAPEVFEWRPYPLGSNPTGYTFPSFLALWDKDGNEVAAPRWALMERCEPEQYLREWENERYIFLDTPDRVTLYDDQGNVAVEKGKMHDAKGPPPEGGMYTRWHVHAAHQDGCCLRAGNEHHCWGYYAPPNETLLRHIGKAAWAARNDKEIDPFKPVALLPENRTGNTRTTKKLEAAKVEADLPIAPRFKESPNIWIPE